MGIKEFHKTIKHKYDKSFQKKWLLNYDHVYIDINYALHYCSYGAKSEEDVFIRLYIFFDNMLQDLIPTKSLIVCSDGVAPLAKLILQRQRRLNVSKSFTDITDTNTSETSISNNTVKNNTKFNTLVFTAGTEFMKNLQKKLENYFKYVEYAYQIKIDYLEHKFDEAELKLKGKLMENMKENINDSHIVVTNDSDVIVMLTTLQNVQNTFVLYRNNHQNETLSIGKLLDLHTNMVGTSLCYNLDFSLISIMMGNDYIPKIGLADFEKIWESYKEVLKTNPNGLVNKNLEINPIFITKLLYGIIKRSKNLFLNKINYRSLFNKMYGNYLDGLTWCLHTYYEGKCIRYNYMYEDQNAPHPLALIINIKQNPDLLKINKNTCKPIKPSLYSILVLPSFAQNLISKKYNKFIEDNNILYTEEKCKKCSDFYKEIKILNSEFVKNENKENLVNIKKNINNISKLMLEHKKNHDKLSLKDITTLVYNFEIYCKKI